MHVRIWESLDTTILIGYSHIVDPKQIIVKYTK